MILMEEEEEQQLKLTVRMKEVTQLCVCPEPSCTTCDRMGYTQTTTYNIFTVMRSLQYDSHDERQKPSTSYFSFSISFIAYLIHSN